MVWSSVNTVVEKQFGGDQSNVWTEIVCPNLRLRMHLPIYAINLDRRPDRWEAVTGNLGRLSLRPTRITAVDGQTASHDELKKWVATDNAPFLTIVRGAQACVLSHARAWEALLGSSLPAPLVAEDNALFAAGIGSVPGDDLAWRPDRAGPIQLETLRDKKRLLLGSECGRTPEGRAICQVACWSGVSAAYLVDRRAGRDCLGCRFRGRHADRRYPQTS